MLEIKTKVEDSKFIGDRSLNQESINQYSRDYVSILNHGLLNYPETNKRKQSKGKNLLDRWLLSDSRSIN